MKTEMKMRTFAIALSLCLTAFSASAQAQKDYSAAKIKLLGEYAKVQPAYVPLEVGEVKPRGWILEWAQAAANGITGHLDEYQPVYGNGWKGFGFKAMNTNPKDGTGWPIEQCSYWLDGAVKLAYMIDDEALKRKVADRLAYVIDGVVDKGAETFIWWKDKSIVNDGFNNWGHGIMGRALVSYYQATHNPKILRALTKVYEHFPIQLPDGSFAVPRGATNIDAMTEAFLASGDTAILHRIVEYSRNQGVKQNMQMLSSLDGRKHEGYRTMHGVTFYEGVRVPVILNMWSGDGSELQAARHFMDWGFGDNLLPLGLTSCEEYLSGVGAMRSVETCCVPTSMWAYTWFTRLTGETRWMDLAESVFLNAGPAPIARDWKTMCYYQQLDRLSTTLPGEPPVPGDGDLMFTPFGAKVLCCVGSCNWIIPNYVQNMWMATPDGGLACMLYGPCEVKKQLGETMIDIVCDTEFPFGERIEMTLKTDGGRVKMPLSFRVPEWAEGMTVAVNGREQHVEAVNGMVRIEREWTDGDRISVRLPMHVSLGEGKEIPYPRDKYFVGSLWKSIKTVNRQVADSICGAPFQYVKYGPLLFSLALEDVSENEVKPNQPFQFALNVANVRKDIKVERAEMPRQWSWKIADAPIKLRVKACNVDWTPTWSTPLPRDGVNKLGDTWLTLVPYNVTKFRVTLFPKLK